MTWEIVAPFPHRVCSRDLEDFGNIPAESLQLTLSLVPPTPAVTTREEAVRDTRDLQVLPASIRGACQR